MKCIQFTLILLWCCEAMTGLSAATTPSISFLVRSYAGDCHELRTRLLASFDMFLDESRFPVTIVLDKESEDDHKLGRCLESIKPRKYYTIAYEEEPPIKFYYDSYGGGTGYMRQHWSNFYSDRYSEADIICIMDSDSLLYTRFMSEEIISETQRLFVFGRAGDNYPQNEVFVSNVTHSAWMHGSVANMAIDRFPMCFWRDTFSNFRDHIERVHEKDADLTTFDEIFESYQHTNSRGHISQFSAIASYALLYEKDRYEFRNVDKSGNETVFIGGQHGPDRLSDDIFAVSCCAMLAKKDPLSECNNRHMRGSFFMLQHHDVGWGMKLKLPEEKYPFLTDPRLLRIVDAHLLRVHRMRSASLSIENRMRNACAMRLHADEYIDGCSCCANCTAKRHHSGGAMDALFHVTPYHKMI